MKIIDNFLPNPDEVRQDALNSNFIDWVGHDGELYKRICVKEIPGLRKALELHIGKVDMLGMAYRLNYSDELPNSSIHTDVGWGTHAMVLYLTDGPSGTAFWKHKETGAVKMAPGDIDTFINIRLDTEDESKWDMINYVPMAFNRAAIYSSELFHSRHPFKAFGASPESGRLTAVAFFTPRSGETGKTTTGAKIT